MRPRRRPNNCKNESCLKGVKISRRRPVGDTGKVAGGKSAIGRHYQAGLRRRNERASGGTRSVGTTSARVLHLCRVKGVEHRVADAATARPLRMFFGLR